ncbi:MAG: hypothetical protein CM15mV28_0650 [Thaumasvirus sp.]|nr:MAG: hypothetical protein CM15mV28_0650 [Thaumasvirus sp.]
MDRGTVILVYRKEGCPHDLAGLVCNNHGDETCINPCKGSTSGQTWEYRRGMIDGLTEGMVKIVRNVCHQSVLDFIFETAARREAWHWEIPYGSSVR